MQIYYNGATLEADRVIYDQKTKRVHAEGNVKLTEASGRVTYGEIINLSDDFRDGFVDSLRLDTPDQTRMAAARADRSGGNITVLQSGVYTACEACADDPRKPPKWQVKAARIIHDQGEQMIYFEDARLEFFGVPLAYMPYFSTPDPTAKRKTGFLIPTMRHQLTLRRVADDALLLGAGAELRLHAHAQDHQQAGSAGPGRVASPAAERLLHDPRVRHFPARPGCLRRHAGRSRVARRHQLDRPVPHQRPLGLRLGRHHHQRQELLPGLRVLQICRRMDLMRSTPDYVMSQAYLQGRGERSFFDLRALYFYGFTSVDDQKQIPIVHPVLNHEYVFARPVLGGELSAFAAI